MKLVKIRDEYHVYTGKVSDLSRQLAFAGIAVAWIFKTDQMGVQKLPQPLILPVGLLVACLLADFLQYVYGAIAYSIRYETAERRTKRDSLDSDFNFKVSRNWVVRPMKILFCLKAALVAFAYLLIACHFATQVI